MLEFIFAIAVTLGAAEVNPYEAQAPKGRPLFEARIVCPERGPFRFSHGSTIIELPDGALFCAWYAGSREKGDDVVIAGSDLAAGASTWTEPRRGGPEKATFWLGALWGWAQFAASLSYP